MDYAQEIAQNNARIAELQGRLQELRGMHSMGTDEMDYQLAAQRASFGDMSGAQYHLNKPEERKRMEQFRLANEGSFSSDVEYQYAKLKDALSSAEDDFAMVPPSNTRIYNRMKKKVEQARRDLKIFEKRNPEMVKMHWRWAGQVDNTPVEETPEPPPSATIEGGKAMIEDLIMTGTDGNIYLKEGADVEPTIDYFKKIPYWWENEDVRNQIKYLKGLKTPQQAADTPTVQNAEIQFKLDPEKFKNNLWVDEKSRNEAKEWYDKLPIEQKNSKEAMAFKASLSRWTKAEYNNWKKAMHEEGKRLFESLPQSKYDIAAADNKFTVDGRTWTRKDKVWETDNTWRKK